MDINKIKSSPEKIFESAKRPTKSRRSDVRSFSLQELLSEYRRVENPIPFAIVHLSDLFQKCHSLVHLVKRKVRIVFSVQNVCTKCLFGLEWTSRTLFSSNESHLIGAFILNKPHLILSSKLLFCSLLASNADVLRGSPGAFLPH